MEVRGSRRQKLLHAESLSKFQDALGNKFHALRLPYNCPENRSPPDLSNLRIKFLRPVPRNVLNLLPRAELSRPLADVDPIFGGSSNRPSRFTYRENSSIRRDYTF